MPPTVGRNFNKFTKNASKGREKLQRIWKMPPTVGRNLNKFEKNASHGWEKLYKKNFILTGIFIKGIFNRGIFITGIFITRKIHFRNIQPTEISSTENSSHGIFILRNIIPRNIDQCFNLWCVCVLYFNLFDKIAGKILRNACIIIIIIVSFLHNELSI